MKKILFLALLLQISIFCMPARANETTAQNLILNPGFESTSDWQIQPQNGAAGNSIFDTSKARSGKQSLKLTKTNGLGYVELRSIKPIHIEPNVLYFFRGWFHAEDAPISSLLLFRISTDGKRLIYNSIDRSAGFKSQSLLINSRAGYWEQREITYKSDKAEDIYLHVALWGNPCSVWLDDLELTSAKEAVASAPVTFDFAYSKEQALQILKNRPNDSAKVVDNDGEMQFEIDGKKQPFVFYKGMKSTEDSGDIAAFGKAGVNLTSVAIQLGQSRFAYVPKTEKAIWAGKDKINFDVIDDTILSVLRKNPQAKIILETWVYPYKEWGDENPDDVVRNDKGVRGYGIWGNLTGYTDDLSKVNTKQNDAWWYPSYQSQKWRDDSSAALTAIAQHLKTSVYGKAVVGFFISGGQDLRFDPFFYDYSKPSESTFRAWVLQKYGNVANVAKAWNQPLTSADQIVVPQFNNQYMEAQKPYNNPGPLLDYREFKDEGTWSLRDGYAKALKENIGKPVVTLSYDAPVSRNFLTTKYLDGAGDMTYYPYRNNGYALGWLPGDGYKYHHKKFMQEVDLRSYVGSRYGAAGSVYQTWIGAGLTPEAWDNIHRKMIGASLARGYGWWYYDMGRYFADLFIHQKIGETYKAAEELNAMPKSTFRPDVCIIGRDDPDPYLSGRFTATDFGDDYQNMMLESSGVPFEKHYLQDVLDNPQLQNFKVYIFQQTSFITQSQRQEIKQKLLNKNRTIVWMNDAGYISENGKSVSEMSDLIGMKIQTEEKYTRLNAIVTDHDSALTQNVAPFQGAGEMLMAIFNTNGGSHSATARYQPFWIDDSSATVFGKYHETGQAAMAIKKFPNWISIYLAAPQALGPQLLNNIAKQAGAFVAGDADEELDMNGNFASLHGLKSGEYHLHLPTGKTRVVDALTGKVLSDKKESYTFPVEAQKTYWFFFQ